MKSGFFLVCLFFAVSCIQATSVEQIAKLGELKTKDELILQLVQKEGLDRPLTTDDAIMLREKGVSERVIEYLLNLTPPERTITTKQEGESVYISKNLRAYQTRDKKGKPILMVTNMDENGKRMGPPPPPNPEPDVVREAEPPREVYVTVRHEEPERYPDEEEYVEDPYYDPGIPYYPVYGGYPYYPVKPPHGHFPGHSGKGHYRFDKPWGSPPARNSQGQTRTPVNTMRPGSARASSRSR
jgi:hypothetical protein